MANKEGFPAQKGFYQMKDWYVSDLTQCFQLKLTRRGRTTFQSITNAKICQQRLPPLQWEGTHEDNFNSVVFRESVRKNARDCFEKKGFAGNYHFQGIANYGYLYWLHLPLTKCSRFTLFLKIGPKYALFSKIGPKFAFCSKIDLKFIVTFCSKIGPKIFSMADKVTIMLFSSGQSF